MEAGYGRLPRNSYRLLDLAFFEIQAYRASKARMENAAGSSRIKQSLKPLSWR